jgi:hypothetical protein
MLALAEGAVLRRAPVDPVLLARVRAEFREMPGLRLTAAQARRLWALDPAVCDCVLTVLSRDGFLRRTADGSFVRGEIV